MDDAVVASEAAAPPRARIGVFAATMLVMGGIVGAGIFSNPVTVAGIVGSAPLALAAWGAGGIIALTGAFVYAELAARHPARGGQYAYMRDAFHPAVAFMFGWAILLVVQTGGIAAVAVTFARYFLAIVPLPFSESAVATATLAILTIVNCANVRAGNALQTTFMVLKIAAIAGIVACGVLLVVRGISPAASAPTPSAAPFAAFAAALTPVMFAYGGWATASFAAGDMRDPRRDLSRAMLFGVLGVVALYLAVNAVFLSALGVHGLAATTTPAAAVVDRLSARAHPGATIIAGFIALSTLGFLSQGLFAVPRVYQAMGADGLFFRAIGRVSPRTGAPVAAVALQGAFAAIVAASGTYAAIMSYVISVDFLFYGLAALALLVFRHRRFGGGASYGTPGGAVTITFFMLASWAIVAATIASDPRHALIGIFALALGVPAYWGWTRSQSGHAGERANGQGTTTTL